MTRTDLLALQLGWGKGMASLDIVAMLRHDAEQLMRMSEQSHLAGKGAAVRVLAPEMLHAVMMDAADEIETLRQARSEARSAALEEAARHIDKRWLTNASQTETVLLKGIATELRALIEESP